MIAYMESPKESIEKKKLVELVSELSKVREYKTMT